MDYIVDWKRCDWMIFQTGWYFTVIYLLGFLIIYLVFPKESYERFFENPNSQNNNQISETIINICWFFPFIYSIFLPVKYENTLFNLFFIIFLISMILYEITLFNYASTPVGEPIQKGIYKYSRNPQYIFDFIIWICIGIMCSSYLIIILKIIESILQHKTIIEEEQYCLKRYGEEYEKYLEKTPRYFLFFWLLPGDADLKRFNYPINQHKKKLNN